MCTKLENLWKIHAASWESFRRRADHEFRFSVAVWTAAVALVGLGLKGGLRPHVPPWLAVSAPAAFVFLHWWYERGMARSNDTDLDKCYALEDAIMTEIHYAWPEEVQRHFNRHKPMGSEKLPWHSRLKGWWRRKISKNWSHIGHVGVTAVLAFIAAFLLYTVPSSCVNKPEPLGGRPQEITASREAVPIPTGSPEGAVFSHGDTTDLPNKANAAERQKAAAR